MKIPVLTIFWPNPLEITYRGDHKELMSQRRVQFKRDLEFDVIRVVPNLTTEFQKRIAGAVFAIDSGNSIKWFDTVTFNQYEINIKTYFLGARRLENNLIKALKDELEFVIEKELAFKS
ncbi:MAG: hypothetical protein RL641_267 [Candidatus Parcubacteria bacterium]|jgi:hypothetical protein